MDNHDRPLTIYCWLTGEKCIYRFSTILVCLPNKVCDSCKALSQNLDLLVNLLLDLLPEHPMIKELIEEKAEIIAEEKVSKIKSEIRAGAIEKLKQESREALEDLVEGLFNSIEESEYQTPPERKFPF